LQERGFQHFIKLFKGERPGAGAGAGDEADSKSASGAGRRRRSRKAAAAASSESERDSSESSGSDNDSDSDSDSDSSAESSDSDSDNEDEEESKERVGGDRAVPNEFLVSQTNQTLVYNRLSSLQLPRNFGSNCSGVFKYTGEHHVLFFDSLRSIELFFSLPCMCNFLYLWKRWSD